MPRLDMFICHIYPFPISLTKTAHGTPPHPALANLLGYIPTLLALHSLDKKVKRT